MSEDKATASIDPMMRLELSDERNFGRIAATLRSKPALNRPFTNRISRG
jgi:hypothetical protein